MGRTICLGLEIKQEVIQVERGVRNDSFMVKFYIAP